ncbi:MAG TPA: tetratricopeptide repeat protein [Candidatus Polarisedimenticolia bacterium]|nr:tetratricopeptide repeat protein [Candidatus Polarisedimenticolia bacterium]
MVACALAVGAALDLSSPGSRASDAAIPSAIPGPGPLSCVLEVSGRDASGNTVLQTVGYALDRPGLVLAPLSATAHGAARWRTLVVAPDALASSSAGAVDVTEILLEDPGRDLMLLRAPGLGACEAGDSAAVPPAAAGDALIGIRNRDGYRSRVYRAVLDRSLPVRGGPDLLRLRVPDGGGAGSGFLLDGRRRLIGSVLPPPAGGDRLFACAVPIDRPALDAAATRTGRPLLEAPPAPLVQAQPARTAAGLLAQALLLTRDDQADRVLALLDEAVSLSGDSDVLLMERGAWRFRIGRTEAAILDFARAAVLNPRLFLAHLNLGVALGTTGRYPEAADAFKRALSIDPYNAPARYQLAVALAAAKHRDQARGEYERLRLLDASLARDLGALLQF